MWTLTQLSPKTEMIGTFETFAEIKVKIAELTGKPSDRLPDSDGNPTEGVEAIYLSAGKGVEYEAYNHG